MPESEALASASTAKIGTSQSDRHFIALSIGTALRFLIWYDNLLTAIGLPPGGSSIVHIYNT